MATTRPQPVDHQDRVMQSGGIAAVRQRVLVSGAFLLLEFAVADFWSEDYSGRVGFWFVFGACMLWLVYRRRSRVARGIVIVLAFCGVGVYLLAAFPSVHATVLMAAYLGQALPLLSGPVRRHVQQRT